MLGGLKVDTQAVSTIVTSKDTNALILSWISVKSRKSGSSKTKKAYEDTILAFRSGLQAVGLDLSRQDDQALMSIAILAQEFAARSKNNKEVRPATINQRLAIISSFYEYCIKQGALKFNPIKRADRMKVQAYAKATPIHSDEVAERLAKIERESLQGKRDYAIVVLLLYTGRRLSEVAELSMEHLELHNGKITVTFDCKGGKVLRDELPYAVTHAIIDWLKAFYKEEIAIGHTGDNRPIWVALANKNCYGKRLGTQAIADICQSRLGTSKVHATRHTWAHQMEEAGAPISVIQAKLGHESLATTGRYLASLKQAKNDYGDKLAANLGIR